MRRLTTRGWLAGHALAAALIAGCLALGWWQIGRAAGGNTLSWAYAVEWPVFAGFVGFVWWREVRRTLGHDEATAADATGPAGATGTAGTADATGASPQAGPSQARRPVFTARPAPPADDPDDPELAAYNRYLAWLNANPGARPADYPGPAGGPRVEEKTWAQP